MAKSNSSKGKGKPLSGWMKQQRYKKPQTRPSSEGEREQGNNQLRDVEEIAQRVREGALRRIRREEIGNLLRESSSNWSPRIKEAIFIVEERVRKHVETLRNSQSELSNPKLPGMQRKVLQVQIENLRLSIRRLIWALNHNLQTDGLPEVKNVNELFKLTHEIRESEKQKDEIDNEEVRKAEEELKRLGNPLSRKSEREGLYPGLIEGLFELQPDIYRLEAELKKNGLTNRVKNKLEDDERQLLRRQKVLLEKLHKVANEVGKKPISPAQLRSLYRLYLENSKLVDKKKKMK